MAIFERCHAPSRAFLPAGYQNERLRINTFSHAQFLGVLLSVLFRILLASPFFSVCYLSALTNPFLVCVVFLPL